MMKGSRRRSSTEGHLVANKGVWTPHKPTHNYGLTTPLQADEQVKELWPLACLLYLIVICLTVRRTPSLDFNQGLQARSPLLSVHKTVLSMHLSRACLLRL